MTPLAALVSLAAVAAAGCRDAAPSPSLSPSPSPSLAPAASGLVSDAMVAQVIARAPIEEYFGVSINGKKVGWARVRLRRAAPGEPGGVASESELSVHRRDAPPVTSVETRYYDATAPYRMVAIESTGGAAPIDRRSPPTRETLHGVVAQLYAEPAWLVAGRSETFAAYDPELGRDDTDVVRVVEATAGGAVIESRAQGESAVSRVTLGADGIAQRADHGTFALERQPRDTVQAGVIGFDPVGDAIPVDRLLGDAARLARLDLIVGVADGFALPGSPRQRVERRADGRYQVMLTVGPGEPVTPEARRDALAVTSAVDAGDPDIRRLAAEITAGAATDRARVQALVGWVFSSMRKELSTNLATASRVEELRAGDCTEHSLLLVALARAAGIPAREVSGLVYMGDDHQRFGYHAWVEVAIDGAWWAVDPTFGQRSADPTHLAFGTGSDATWVMTMGAITISAP